MLRFWGGAHGLFKLGDPVFYFNRGNAHAAAASDNQGYGLFNKLPKIYNVNFT